MNIEIHIFISNFFTSVHPFVLLFIYKISPKPATNNLRKVNS